MAEVRIAKKDVIAEVDEGGVKVTRKVAIEGQPVPAAYADLVDDKDVDTEVEKTRMTGDRRAAAEDEDREPPDHDDHRATAAAPAEIKRRTRSRNKARGGSKSKADDDE